MQFGDRVSWTHVASNTRTLSMRLRKGTIVAITGDMSEVKTDSGKRVIIETRRLRLDGEKSQISEFIEAIRGD